jgi:hypothetical protein
LDPYKIIFCRFCSFKFLPVLSKNTIYLNDNEVNPVFVNARDLQTSATRSLYWKIKSHLQNTLPYLTDNTGGTLLKEDYMVKLVQKA